MDHGRSSITFEHEYSEGDDMQSGQGFWQAFVVAGQLAASRHPGEGSFGHPAPGQRHAAALGIGQLDDLQRGPCAWVLSCARALPVARAQPITGLGGA